MLDHLLRVRILPWATWRRPYFPNAHSVNSALKVLAIDAITISEEITRRVILRKYLDYLLRRTEVDPELEVRKLLSH